MLPVINISEELFRERKQFEVIYALELELSVNRFKNHYKNQEVIDCIGDCYFIYGAEDISLNFGNLMRIYSLWPLPVRNSTKTTLINTKRIRLLFKKIDKQISLDELRTRLIAKVPEYHFCQEKPEQVVLLEALEKSNSYEELMNLVYEEN